jgi:hypothetical protein
LQLILGIDVETGASVSYNQCQNQDDPERGRMINHTVVNCQLTVSELLEAAECQLLRLYKDAYKLSKTSDSRMFIVACYVNKLIRFRSQHHV